MVRPDFFIIGAMKSGTTTLANHLIRHPEVFMPGTWEFNYLAQDLHWVNGSVIDNDAAYLAHFTEGQDKKRKGEKSVFYLYSKTAANRIYSLNPRARMICILRDPVKVIWSLYKYNLSNFEENLLDFRKALAAEPDRIQGLGIPTTGTIVENLFYRHIVKYHEQLERYLRLFPSNQMLVLLFDDLIQAPQQLYDQVQDFLEINPHPIPDTKVFNKGEKLHNYKARKLLYSQPLLKKAWNRLVPLDLKSRIKNGLKNIGGKEPIHLQSMPVDLEASLRREFAPEILKLEALLDRDLSGWHQNLA